MKSTKPDVQNESPSVAGLPGEVSLEALCRLLTLTAQRVGQLTKIGILRRLSRGKYPLAESIQSYIAFLRVNDGDPPDDAGDGIGARNDRARLVKAKADLLELQVAEAVGGSDDLRARRRAETIAINAWFCFQRSAPYAMAQTIAEVADRRGDVQFMHEVTGHLRDRDVRVMDSIYFTILEALLDPLMPISDEGAWRIWRIPAHDGQLQYPAPASWWLLRTEQRSEYIQRFGDLIRAHVLADLRGLNKSEVSRVDDALRKHFTAFADVLREDPIK